MDKLEDNDPTNELSEPKIVREEQYGFPRLKKKTKTTI
jgi:hypothetical protein